LFRRIVGCGKCQAHDEALSIEQRGWQPTSGTRMCDHADAFEQSALLQHRACASNDPADDWIDERPPALNGLMLRAESARLRLP
jgi:hypothetical protein